MFDFEKFLKSLPKYYIEIGVISGKSKRKIKVGITNAELMFIHENGSPLRHIPARPVLQMTLDYANKELIKQTMDRCIKIYFRTFSIDEVEKELNRMCLRLQNYARSLIYDNDGRLVENAPSTIRRKGYNHPLFQTGQLARSITCHLIKL